MAGFEFLEITRLLTVAMAAFCIAFALRHAPRTPLATYFALFAGSMCCAALGNLYGDRLGPTAAVIAIGGFAGCGWSWLFARALFQPKPVYEIWPLALVAVIIAPEIIAQTLIMAGVAPTSFTGPIWRIADNTQDLASSTVLVLALVEAVRGYSPSLPAHERRFREIFIAFYASLVAFAVLWVSKSADGSIAAQWKDGVQTTGAFAALAMAALAIRHRLAFPMPASTHTPRTRQRNAAIAGPEMEALAAKITALFDTQDVFATPNLKVSDLADMLGTPDYKVSRCVTGAMGFANFNRLANHYRVEHAKQMLCDPQNNQAILSIGLDCGFGSIGPFNRAFKEATGKTPRSYRAAQSAEKKSSRSNQHSDPHQPEETRFVGA